MYQWKENVLYTLLPLFLNISSFFSRQKKKSVRKYNPHFKLLDTFIYFFQIHTINTTKCFGRWGVRVEHIHKQNGILGTSIHKIDTLNTIPTFFLFWYNTTHFCFVSRELPTFFIFLIYVKIAKGAYNNGQMYDIYIERWGGITLHQCNNWIVLQFSINFYQILIKQNLLLDSKLISYRFFLQLRFCKSNIIWYVIRNVKSNDFRFR